VVLLDPHAGRPEPAVREPSPRTAGNRAGRRP